MTLSIAVARKNALLPNYGALFASGTLRVYAGAIPTDADTALGAQVLLGTLGFGSTPFAAPSGGSISAQPITRDNSADVSGTASFFRSFDSGGVIIEQGTITATGGGGDLELNTVNIVAGGPIEVTGFARSM
jgi:hypothetical protein